MKIKDHFLSQEIFEIKETSIKGVFKTFPIPQNISKYYESEDYISHHQDSGSLKEKLYKFLQSFNLIYKRDIILKEMKVFSNACVDLKSERNAIKILDYGCGAGEFLKVMEKDFSTIGFEPNEDARNAAQQKTSKTQFISNLNDIENESLDVITLWHVFEHIENQDEILENFYKKLKPNGKLIIAVPNCTSYDAKHYVAFWAAYDVPRHIYHFSKTGMQNLIKEKSEHWNLKKIRYLLLDSFYISMLSEKYKKNALSWFFGGIHGAISNFKALKTGEFSSLVYIIEKK